LIACMVKTLNESDPTFKERFVENLDRIYADIRDDYPIECLETITWATEMIATGEVRKEKVAAARSAMYDAAAKSALHRK
jgi:hypothetical protein